MRAKRARSRQAAQELARPGQERPQGPAGPTRGMRIGYWDPARNVMVVDEHGKIWICPYRRRR
jgi:hypothetical protein